MVRGSGEGNGRKPLSVASNYSEAEVARMLHYYQSMIAIADVTRVGLKFVVMLADLEQAMEKLDPDSWGVVFLCGLLNLKQNEAALLLKIDQSNVSRRWSEALAQLHHHINGGTLDYSRIPNSARATVAAQ